MVYYYYRLDKIEKKDKKFSIFKSWINFINFCVHKTFTFEDKITASITLFKNKNNLIYVRIHYFELDNNLHNTLKYNPIFYKWKNKKLNEEIFSIENNGKCPYYDNKTNEGVYYIKLIHPLYDETYNENYWITSRNSCEKVFTEIFHNSGDKYENNILEDKDFRANLTKHEPKEPFEKGLGSNENMGELFNQIIDYTQNYLNYSDIYHKDMIEYLLSSQLYNWIEKNKMYCNSIDYDQIIEDITHMENISDLFQRIDNIRSL